jgi:hypothetical protein
LFGEEGRFDMKRPFFMCAPASCSAGLSCDARSPAGEAASVLPAAMNK